MSRFTDTAFGFSFWYPAAWKVVNEPVFDPTRDGWFPDAKIVKELQLRNPAATGVNDQPAGVVLQVLVAPTGLTELGRSKSQSPVGIDQKYYFDTASKRWMLAWLTVAPDGKPPGSSPQKILKRTAGGLPIFAGAVRGGAELIVPLDRVHFLAISTLDPGGYDSHVYLAATVMATNARAGQYGTAVPASEQLRTLAIRREGVKLGAIGESLGYWYKDRQHVYDFGGDGIAGADPKTFTPLSQDSALDPFARDALRVYDRWGAPIPGADPKTFVGTGSLTARDAHHTYDWSSGALKISSVGTSE